MFLLLRINCHYWVGHDVFLSFFLLKSSLDIPSAQWLKIHGLIAKRLTIMDALAPTAVARTTTYIPILDKHVVSKVFDDVSLSL